MYLLFCFVLISGIFNSIETDGKEIETKMEDKNIKQKVLVVYYSRTGNTEKVANLIAEQLNADIERIVDKKNRKGFLGFIIAGRDAILRKTTEIEEVKNDSSRYDLIILGTPIWAGKMTPAIRTYILNNKNSFRDIACFTTSGSDEPQKIASEIEKITGKKLSGFFGIKGKELKNKSLCEEKIKSFTSLFKK